MSKRIVCLMGPTASGKTQLAIELAAHFPVEIVSVDSALVYRDMTIGTAKPSIEELEKAPHHLIDIIDPVESYSAAAFCQDAIACAEDIFARGKLPLLVGGTMMYFNALQQGLSTLPQANEDIRKQINQEAEEQGWEVLHQKLANIDPRAAKRIHPNDTQRISRALEVFAISGKTLSECLEKGKPDHDYEFINIVLFPENRTWLHERIALRFKQMLAEGFLDEVKALIDKWSLTPDMPSLRCVGYRQAYEVLTGDSDEEHLEEKGTAATRQLAKRQLTWLRHWPQAHFFDPQSSDCASKIMAKVKEILDNDSFELKS